MHLWDEISCGHYKSHLQYLSNDSGHFIWFNLKLDYKTVYVVVFHFFIEKKKVVCVSPRGHTIFSFVLSLVEYRYNFKKVCVFCTEGIEIISEVKRKYEFKNSKYPLLRYRWRLWIIKRWNDSITPLRNKARWCQTMGVRWTEEVVTLFD